MKKSLLVITTIIGVALIALLAYSVERSAWLLELYEAPKTADDGSGPALAMAAALVAELGAVALIVGEAAIGLVGHERTAKRLARWAGFGLLLILSLQSVAGIIAGYTRGGGRMLDTIGAGNNDARFAVAAVALLLGNLVVPGLILALSKIAALLVGQLVIMHPEPVLSYARTAVVECLVCGAPNAGNECQECGKLNAAQMPILEGIKGIAYACPKCTRELSPAQFGAAKRWGYCKACKANS